MAILGVPLDLLAISKAAFSSIFILNLFELNKIIFFKSDGYKNQVVVGFQIYLLKA